MPIRDIVDVLTADDSLKSHLERLALPLVPRRRAESALYVRCRVCDFSSHCNSLRQLADARACFRLLAKEKIAAGTAIIVGVASTELRWPNTAAPTLSGAVLHATHPSKVRVALRCRSSPSSSSSLSSWLYHTAHTLRRPRDA
jgi:ribosomal protein S14